MMMKLCKISRDPHLLTPQNSLLTPAFQSYLKHYMLVLTSCRMYPGVPPRKATLMTIQGPLTMIRAMQNEEGASSGSLLFETDDNRW